MGNALAPDPPMRRVWRDVAAEPRADCGRGARAHAVAAARVAMVVGCALIAALYIDRRGVYPTMRGVDCWDRERDATTYAGPWPIVAHPACGPWGRLRHLYRGSEGGPELALIAVEQVKRWGGVLEHPAHSRLWPAAKLPRPGEPADEFGGVTVTVNQSDFGHVARKPTWIYAVRVDVDVLAWRPPPREPTHWVGGGHKGGVSSSGVRKSKAPAHIKICSAQQRRRTPKLFAEWLVLLAETAGAR